MGIAVTEGGALFVYEELFFQFWGGGRRASA